MAQSNTRPKKTSVNHSNLDRISDLPSHIIDDILSCLPIKEAVKTSVLSKKWMLKWRYLPKLVFDSTFYQTSIVPSTPKLSIAKFFLNIYRVLLLHRGPILNFTFHVPLSKNYSEIDRVMLYLSEKDVHEISFDIGEYFYEDCRVPPFLFSCVTLRRLTLSWCNFTLPLAFQGFVNLISLTFQSVDVSTNVLENFISKCPLLERLSIKSCNYIDNLYIDIPCLKFFEFFGFFQSLCFEKPCQHLSTIIFDNIKDDVTIFSHDAKASEPTKLFECLPAVEHLRLGFEFVDYLIVGPLPRKLSLGCLRVLELLDICFQSTAEVSAVHCLISSAPNLEKLEIGFVAPRDEATSASEEIDYLLDNELLKVEDVLDNELKKLRVVKMKLPDIEIIEAELEFVKFLLAESVVLEKMFVQPGKGTLAEDGLKILKEIIRFERSSKKAQILYLEPEDDDKVSNDGSDYSDESDDSEG
ncbi:F-box/FBD/LRR-repeat protein At1g13570-like [Mercurialis annua]|uniref:F-box/FBD/LRR-repeat protein At1g13570-like n=1 Tax=Mercurialis annua TaxID=3986 RepID=UPI00215FB1C6|nr:F-box/FBD/LRR-repeat protein At1g13570-like [Mercurialis annua]